MHLLTTTQAAAMEDFLAHTGVGQREDEKEEEEDNGLNRDKMKRKKRRIMA